MANVLTNRCWLTTILLSTRFAMIPFLMLAVWCRPAGAAAGDGKPAAPIKIYVDESRSLQLGVSLWKHLHRRDGCFQTRVMDLITYERLRQYDVMVICNQLDDIAYSNDELTAVRRFVEDGGGLLIFGCPRKKVSEVSSSTSSRSLRSVTH